MSKNALLDPWYGARDFVNNHDLSTISISKQDFEEQGAGYIKEHFCSNIFVKLDDD